MYEHVRKFMESGVMPQGLNDTLISTIPKVSNSELVSQFHPISLCNVSYKVITKVMANRIRHILPKIISPEQSSFVPGRQIVDNIITYQEIVHSMKKKKGKVGYMMFKIDLEKAYDRLN